MVSLCKICKCFMFQNICPICRWIRPPKMKPIELKTYLGGHDTDPKFMNELTPELLSNARRLLERTTKLLEALKDAKVLSDTPELCSGWRPSAYNATIPGAAKHSKHIICLAIDLSDGSHKIANYLKTNVKLLEELDLAIEDPSATPSWCHIQIGAAASGRRVFLP